MIDASTLGMLPPQSPACAPEPRGETGTAFATLLMQAMQRDGDTGSVPALPEPPLSTEDTTDPRRLHDPAIDHAIRFDARGILDATALEAAGARQPVAGTGAATGVLVDGQPVRSIEVAQPAAVTVARLTVDASPVDPEQLLRHPALDPESRVFAVDSGTLDRVRGDEPGRERIVTTRAIIDIVRAMSRATALPTPVEIGSPLPTDEQGNAPASPTRNPARRAFAAMAQGAPQVAVAALSDGLAVAAAVGALSDDERHRLREVIAATLSRHGYHPRTVTVLAMPTAPGPMES
jgi:hypothetical protein